MQKKGYGNEEKNHFFLCVFFHYEKPSYIDFSFSDISKLRKCLARDYYYFIFFSSNIMIITKPKVT